VDLVGVGRKLCHGNFNVGRCSRQDQRCAKRFQLWNSIEVRSNDILIGRWFAPAMRIEHAHDVARMCMRVLCSDKFVPMNLSRRPRNLMGACL
jgi:hypothetical protein